MINQVQAALSGFGGGVVVGIVGWELLKLSGGPVWEAVKKIGYRIWDKVKSFKFW